MRKFIWLLYQPYKWLIFIPLVFILTFFIGLATVATVFVFGQTAASQSWGVIWSRLLCLLTPITIKIRGRENITKNQSYVIIANHISQYDILVLYGWLKMDFRWVMKKELRKFPGLGIACDKIGHIFVDRSSPISALETIKKARLNIIDGISVVIFPEGTRSMDGELQNFKKGAFKLAFDLELPILPVTISGTREILPAGSFNLFPGRAGLTFHPPIQIKDYTWENVNVLINKVKDTIQGEN